VIVLSVLSKSLLSSEELEYIKSVASKYKAIPENQNISSLSKWEKERLKTVLSKRIRPIPVPIALGQSALESGWGSSRFATEGNNLFGHTTTLPNRDSLRPVRYRGNDRNYKRFDSIEHAIARYMLNINSHDAYSEFHDIREKNPNDFSRMVFSMRKYSRLGDEYTERLHKLIIKYKLKNFADTSLADISRLINLHNVKSPYFY